MPAKRPDAPDDARATPEGDVHSEAPPAAPLDAAPARAAAPSEGDAPEPEEGEGPERKTIEAWAAELHTPAFVFEGAKARKAWGIGQMVTKSQFDAAVRAFGRLEMS